MRDGIKCLRKVCVYNIDPSESSCLVQSSIIFKSHRTVDLSLTKPYCLVVKYKFAEKKFMILSLIIDSISLHIILVKLIGL